MIETSENGPNETIFDKITGMQRGYFFITRKPIA